MSRMLAFSLLFILAFSCKASDEWNFIRVGKDLSADPKWTSSYGKAHVEINNGKLKIMVFYHYGKDGGVNYEYTPDPQLLIEGTVSTSGKISAIARSQSSDAVPAKLHGKLKTWEERRLWEPNKMRVETYKQITFPMDPYYEFYGFLSKEITYETVNP